MDKTVILIVFLVLLFPFLVFGDGITISGVPNYNVYIRGEYTTESSIFNVREFYVYVSNESVVVYFLGVGYGYSLECNSSVDLFIVQSSGQVVLAGAGCESDYLSLGFIICESSFCSVTISCNGCSYSGSLALSDPVPQSGGGDGCAWWDLGCHLRNMFSEVVSWILGVLQDFWSWLVNTIVSVLPQPVRDFFGFMNQIFGFLSTLLVQLVTYFPYFAFVIGLVLSLGLVYYVIEDGLIGVAKFFYMIYDLFKKFFEVILHLIEIIYPF